MFVLTLKGWTCWSSLNLWFLVQGGISSPTRSQVQKQN